MKSYEFKYALYKIKMYAPVSTKIGNIDVTKYLDKLEFGKKINISQKGRTPKFTQ